MVDKLKEWIVDFGSVSIVAKDWDEAFSKALKMVKGTEISIDQIIEWGDYNEPQ